MADITATYRLLTKASFISPCEKKAAKWPSVGVPSASTNAV